MSAPHRVPVAPALHPTVLQSVALVLHPTHGSPVALETKILDLEEEPDGSTTLVVAPPAGYDPLEHHFDATLAWTYPLGRMECPVHTRPGRRDYGAVWLLRPTAPTSRLQERAYFRAKVPVPVLVRWWVDEDEAPLELLGAVVDLSEGGLLATVRAAPPPADTEVEVTVRVDGAGLVQRARVARLVTFAGAGQGLAVEFTDPSVHGDRLRRVVFESERRRGRRR